MPVRPHSRLPAGVAVLAFAALALCSASRSESAPPPAQPGSSPTLEGIRGWVGAFGGASTANADGLEGGSVFGGGAAYYFTRNLGVTVAAERRSLDVVGTTGNALSGGSVNSTVVSGGILVRFPVRPRVVPYLSIGAAYCANSVEVDPGVASALSALNFRVTEDVENKLGFSAGGGVDVLLTRRFALFGEVRYLAASADTSAELTDTVSGTSAGDSGSQDLNELEITAGLRWVF